DIAGESPCGPGNTRGDVGCCLNMLGTGLGLEALDSIADAGLDYLELSLRDLVALGKQAAPTIANLESIGLPCRSCNNLFPGSIRLLGSMFDESAFRLYLERAFDTAAISGARVVVFGSGEARHAGGRPEADWLPELADRLRAIAGVAAQYGIIVAIEPLNRGECDTVNNLNQAKSLAVLAGCANVGLLVDSYHMLLEGDSPGDAANYGPSVVHAHLSAGRERRMPKGNDSFPSAVLSALFSVGYHGRVSIEALSRDPFGELADAVKFIRAVRERVEQNIDRYKNP
ncbi:MAG: sugar phosphate isomerase/epimerase family protein, partial [Rectinemataceae bacterium]|nr:sugar phosphate isomerase/epimerase family protein [Rectinemataceae bacterium]